VIPETHYARHDGLHLAYQVLGDGPPDILLLDQWFGHLEAQWDVAPLAELRERLASFGRLIMYDKRGSGLSDPLAPNQLPTVEEWMDDIPIVLDAVGAEKAVVVANIGGGIMATTYAAAHPERVASLVLVDCFARFTAADDYPFGAPIEDVPRTLESIDEFMGRGLMLNLFAPSEATDDRLVRAWARYERQAASPGMTAATVHCLVLGRRIALGASYDPPTGAVSPAPGKVPGHDAAECAFWKGGAASQRALERRRPSWPERVR